jgi:hypothetical protein
MMSKNVLPGDILHLFSTTIIGGLIQPRLQAHEISDLWGSHPIKQKPS